ncbi:MAG TPA: SURF1 family protein [Bradyrhizobium sp.]|nr:SURF1 family protein [Bradyrhizobium sp.]
MSAYGGHWNGPAGAGSDESRTRATPRPLRTILFVLAVVLGEILLVGLGVWQIERRTWKLDLIARVDRRIAAPATAAPGPRAWPEISRDRDEYRHVRVTGHFAAVRPVLVKALTELGGGYWVLAPFETDQGFNVLVNRGFVPEAAAAATRDDAKGGQAQTSVVGLLRITEPKGAFLRSNDPGQDRWYSRDVAAIGAKLGIADLAPYFIDADASANGAGQPVGGLTVVSFPNNHLIYVVTWFSLAIMLAIWSYRAVRPGSAEVPEGQ